MSQDTNTDTESEGLTDQEQEDLVAAGSTARHIVYSGQDFDVDGLVRRLINDDIMIPTFGINDARVEAEGFQRAFVWRRPQMDKFIESLLLGYPIPGVFLVKQTDNRYLVLDGQQRLMTLKFFFEGIYDQKEFALSNVATDFVGLTYRTLSSEQRRTLENTFIQAIIVSSDGSEESLESIYNIFERLNSGGTQLTPHEIRVALYAGQFIGFLEELNLLEDWRALYGKKSPRLRDQELILRIVSLLYHSDSYKRPLKKFLNNVVGDHRNDDAKSFSKLKNAFELATSILLSGSGKTALRLGGNQVNVAFAEIVMVGLIKRIMEEKQPPTGEEVANVVQELKGNSTVVSASSRSTADEENVKNRLGAAVSAFGEI